MKTPRYLILLWVFISLFSSCAKQYTQLWETRSVNTPSKQNTHVFENDTLRVTYNFWGQNGILAYEVFNKLNKPIYIDWKKSSYIVNSTKLDYWQDEEKIVTSETYQNYLNKDNKNPTGYGVSISKGNILREERITFIPPQSKYSRSQFRIVAAPYSTAQDSFAFDANSSPIQFRNFLTYSTSESFSTESYVNNDFYVSGVKNNPVKMNTDGSKFYSIYLQREKNSRNSEINKGRAVLFGTGMAALIIIFAALGGR